MRVATLYRRLLAAYGPQDWWPADTAAEVCIGAILTQNTSWRNVERAIANLRDARLLDLEALAGADVRAVERLVRPAGYFRQKARRLVGFARAAKAAGGLPALLAGDAAAARDRLLALHGVGPETADSMLCYAGAAPSFVVDAYARRLCDRLPLPAGRAYDEVQAFFAHGLPRDAHVLGEMHALIVRHAKERCTKHAPRCHGCPLRRDCAYGRRSVASGAP